MDNIIFDAFYKNNATHVKTGYKTMASKDYFLIILLFIFQI